MVNIGVYWLAAGLRTSSSSPLPQRTGTYPPRGIGHGPRLNNFLVGIYLPSINKLKTQQILKNWKGYEKLKIVKVT